MIQTKKALMIALLFPILALAALTAYKKYVISFGEEVTLPITGYDPRDLLSGHYLIYQIEYGINDKCPSNTNHEAGYICLEPKIFSYVFPEDCTKLIRGVCSYGRFEAGIEKYFVPENKAKDLEEKVRAGNASIVLSLTHSGKAQVKDLLINGKSWKSQ